MVRRTFWLLLLVACGTSETKAPERSEPPLAWPREAIACQSTAIEQRSTKQWIECMHPTVRADAAEQLEKRAGREGFWEKAKLGQTVLDKAVEAQFDIRSTKDPEMGEFHAKLKLGKDSFEAFRKDLHWYIVDTGL